jgi:hypothetical protein
VDRGLYDRTFANIRLHRDAIGPQFGGGLRGLFTVAVDNSHGRTLSNIGGNTLKTDVIGATCEHNDFAAELTGMFFPFLPIVVVSFLVKRSIHTLTLG